jgi:hypothetical protein
VSRLNDLCVFCDQVIDGTWPVCPQCGAPVHNDGFEGDCLSRHRLGCTAIQEQTQEQERHEQRRLAAWKAATREWMEDRPA